MRLMRRRVVGRFKLTYYPPGLATLPLFVSLAALTGRRTMRRRIDTTPALLRERVIGGGDMLCPPPKQSSPRAAFAGTTAMGRLKHTPPTSRLRSATNF